MDKFKEKRLAWQNLAEEFLKEDKKVYIKDYNGDYYFADILLIGDSTIEIQCFAPDAKANRKYIVYWANVERFEEYREKRT